MVDSPETVAEKALPGWKAVGTTTGGSHFDVDGRTPGMGLLKRKYGLSQSSQGRGFAPASSSETHSEVVVMNPPADMESVGQKFVVVRNGKAVLVQG
ncbi:hypothetical protein [Sphingomonas sp. PR090111-T3T-6A]|uniref:hypothetical protein n=1 Tax=Sphingomonas sp. PR090111-T3T-6A TaxID=685778 RepID=UPI0003A3D6D3|nr:hypothetical protein [Sphingomonas sp. PR090111-T3T-6A]